MAPCTVPKDYTIVDKKKAIMEIIIKASDWMGITRELLYHAGLAWILLGNNERNV
jgi:hypothetical protein